MASESPNVKPYFSTDRLFVATSPSYLRSYSSPQDSSPSTVNVICRAISVEASKCTKNQEESKKMESLKQRLQQLREEAAAENHHKVSRRASALCGDLKKLADSCTGHIDKIVEGQKTYFRGLAEEDLEALIENKYIECNKSKNGKMTKKEFACAMAIMGKEFSDEEVRECFAEVDTNDDKTVCPEEFNMWFRKFVGAPLKPDTGYPGVPSNTRLGGRVSLRLGVSSAPIATLSSPSSARIRGRPQSTIQYGGSPDLNSGKQSPALEIVGSLDLPQLRLSSRDETRFKSFTTSSSDNNDDSIVSVMRSGSSLGTASPTAAKGREAVRQATVRRLSVTAVKEEKVAAELQKRKKLAMMYGRLPGWTARARALRDSSDSSSPKSADSIGEDGELQRTDSSLSRLSSGSTLVNSSADADGLSTPTDVTQATSQHWTSVLRDTFKFKRDSLRDVTHEGQEQSEPRAGPKKLVLSGPLAQLRKAIDSVKVMLKPWSGHGSDSPRDAEAHCDAPIKHMTTTLPQVSEGQRGGSRPSSREGGTSSLMGEYARMKKEREASRLQAKLPAIHYTQQPPDS